MREYLKESTQEDIQRSLFGKINKEYPVVIEKKSEWERLEDPERLKRKFKFDYPKQVIQFIFEVVNYEVDVKHNASILIEGQEVSVEVYTHTVEAVTELDLEYADELNKIYLDVRDYEQRPERDK
jgi:pterin-4a-carbinolamine dehydratase